MGISQDSLYNEVFISYSRKNGEFAKKLVQAIYDSGRENIWIDWEDIEYAEDWWQKIQRGIDSADNFLFILTPDSAESSVCYDEVDHAVQSGKRIIPLLHIEITDKEIFSQLHPAISQHNWLPFKPEDDFDAGMAQLLSTIETDLKHVHFHIRLQTRAREWQMSDNNASYLLTPGELTEAQSWLARANLEAISPEPTDLQQDYIDASQKAEDERQAEQARIARQVRNFQRASIALIVLIISALIAVGFAINTANQARAEVGNAATVNAVRTEIINANERALEAGETLTSIPPTFAAIQNEINSNNTAVAAVGATITPMAATLAQSANEQATASSFIVEARIELANVVGTVEIQETAVSDAINLVVTADAIVTEANIAVDASFAITTASAAQLATATVQIAEVSTQVAQVNVQVTEANAVLTQIVPTLTQAGNQFATANAASTNSAEQMATVDSAIAVSSASLISAGEIKGNIPEGGSEFWLYEGSAGEVVSVSIEAETPANIDGGTYNREGFDTYLILRFPDGQILEFDDIEGADNTNSLAENIVLPTDGIYIIEVRSWDNQSGGNYTLSVERGLISTSTPSPTAQE